MPKTDYRNPLTHGEYQAILGTLTLDNDHRQHLLDSAIRDEIIEARMYCTAPDKETLRKLQFSEEQAQVGRALIIPLWWNGQIVGVQNRPDSPRTDRRGKKQLKYERPTGLPNTIDAHPAMWEALQNTDKPLWITEGAKKVDALASVGEAAVDLLGVCCAFQTRTTEEKELGTLKVPLPQWDDVPPQSRKVILGFDNDVMVKPEVRQAMVETAQLLTYRGAEVEYLYMPYHGTKVGIDDFLASHGNLEKLKLYIDPDLRPGPKEEKVLRDDTALAERLGGHLQDEYAFDRTTKHWRAYGTEKPGVWSRVDQDEMVATVRYHVVQIIGHTSGGKVRSVEGLLRGECGRAFEQTSREWLPLANGVLHLPTMRLRPYSPEYGFIYTLPYDYKPESDCPKTQAWLLEASQGDETMVEFLRACLRAAVLGHTDLQVFFEIFGPPNSGKSTFLRLATALVGQENTQTTQLKYLEGNRFETARFFGKKLILITDAESYTGSLDNLKALTGGDLIRHEEKHVQSGRDFAFQGVVMIATNEPIKCTDRTGAVGRRRLTVNFGLEGAEHRQRQLLEFSNDGPGGELAPELSGVFNWIMAMAEEEMRSWLAPRGRGLDATRRARIEVLLRENSLAAWTEENLAHDPEAETQVGTARSLTRQEAETLDCSTYRYGNQDQWLYPNYRAWCEQTGRKPTAHNTFTETLVNLSRNELEYTDVQKAEGQRTSITAVRLREPGDEAVPLFVSGCLNGAQEPKEAAGGREVSGIGDELAAEIQDFLRHLWQESIRHKNKRAVSADEIATELGQDISAVEYTLQVLIADRSPGLRVTERNGDYKMSRFFNIGQIDADSANRPLFPDEEEAIREAVEAEWDNQEWMDASDPFAQ